MRKDRKHLVTVLLALAVLGLTAVAAKALINPNFTPNDLVEQAKTIVIVKFGKLGEDKRVPMEVVETLKGEKPTEKLILDLSAASQVAWAEHIGKLASGRGDDPVPLFIGEFSELGDSGDEEVLDGALLQIDRDWVILVRGEPGVWKMSYVDSKKQGTWDGGSDTLIRATRYLKDHLDDLVPVEAGCDWIETMRPGKVEGPVSAARAVDLDGKGSFVLFVGAGGGDRLYQWDAGKKEFADVTDGLKLSSKSLASAWGDFNADGRLDLASWDGAELRLMMRVNGGGFAKSGPVALKLEGSMLSLDAVDVGAKGRPGLLVGTEKAPVLLVPDAGEKISYKQVELPVGDAPLAELGKASPCLVADLDGDALYDVLQPFEKGGLVYKGKGGGKFEAGRKVAVSAGKGTVTACTGDFDMDGRLDVYTIGENSCSLWNNLGGFKFADTFGHSGEMSYTAQPGGSGAVTCDLNNDGLQDLLLTYAEESVHHYFNRGYRSFGKSLSLIWENEDVQIDTGEGQQAGEVADLNGDGGQDMALVLKDGSVLVYLREVYEDDPPINVRAVLPPGKGYAGPVTVTGWDEGRCLGAWNVTPGSIGAPVGRLYPGKIKLKWKLPGGQEQEKTFDLKKKRETCILTD